MSKMKRIHFAALVAALTLAASPATAGSPRAELTAFTVRPLSWLRETTIMPGGEYYETDVPDTLDLAERARLAVSGLTQFLDERHHYSSFGHGLFSTRPAVMIHDAGMAQNWGKISEATVLARRMCGSRKNLRQQRASLEGLLSYAELKRHEPYPVPLARIAMTLDALLEQNPQAEFSRQYAHYTQWLQQRMQVDDQASQVFFGTEQRRWERDEADHPMGRIGFGLQVFTAGNVLRSLVRYDRKPARVSRETVDHERLTMLANYARDDRFWQPEHHPVMVVPADHGQFSGHHHSYTQALLGLLYWAHHANDIETLQFVRHSYEYLRTFGMAEIGLFGEACTTGDMTYLAVRLSQWGVGDYWDDVDRYTRNQLAELQIRDVEQMEDIVDRYARPLNTDELGDWAKLPTTRDVIRRSQGLFWSDCSHPTCIQLRPQQPPHSTRLQWVVCCSGNCIKALHVVWDATVEADQLGMVRVNLLLNRASPWLDVESHLPHEGRVLLRLKRDADVAVCMPRWVDKRQLACRSSSDRTIHQAWLGNYLVLPGCQTGEVVALRFPMAERTEVAHLAWQADQFWQESTQPPTYWPSRPAEQYTLTFRGNTLADIQPRTEATGYQLYAKRHLPALREPVSLRRISRFVPSGPASTSEPASAPSSNSSR